MEQYPKEIKLKSGEITVIRILNEEDENKLLEFFRNMPEEDRRVLRHDTTNPEIIKKWCTQIDVERVFPVVAERNEKIIGLATLHMSKYGWQRHIGEIRCVIAKENRGKGLGKILTHELIEKATGVGLHHIQISLIGTQQNEVKIFERLGFKVVARIPKYILDVTGEEHDLILMTIRVSDMWKKFEELIQATEIDTIRGV